uniref:Uncharacterized protein n=1 Tax=Mucochytrium quahogii TaxID=96639 RepID=A0A7S2RSE1_9STRA|mmetsp:Transcript_19858/g.32645  ORF Transcript_19858/g.32645 Transcript_19858/m.32645 type:complete len:456 (+) Transcript_19858:257-1624(+)
MSKVDGIIKPFCLTKQPSLRIGDQGNVVRERWQDPTVDVEIRQEASMKIANIITKGLGRPPKDHRREYKVVLALERLCYEFAKTREEYTDPVQFKILLHRMAAEKAKRRRGRDDEDKPLELPPLPYLKLEKLAQNQNNHDKSGSKTEQSDCFGAQVHPCGAGQPQPVKCGQANMGVFAEEQMFQYQNGAPKPNQRRAGKRNLSVEADLDKVALIFAQEMGSKRGMWGEEVNIDFADDPLVSRVATSQEPGIVGFDSCPIELRDDCTSYPKMFKGQHRKSARSKSDSTLPVHVMNSANDSSHDRIHAVSRFSFDGSSMSGPRQPGMAFRQRSPRRRAATNTLPIARTHYDLDVDVKQEFNQNNSSKEAKNVCVPWGTAQPGYVLSGDIKQEYPSQKIDPNTWGNGNTSRNSVDAKRKTPVHTSGLGLWAGAPNADEYLPKLDYIFDDADAIEFIPF